MIEYKWLSNILLVDSPYIPPEGYRTPKILKNKVSNLSKVNYVLYVIFKFAVSLVFNWFLEISQKNSVELLIILQLANTLSE